MTGIAEKYIGISVLRVSRMFLLTIHRIFDIIIEKHVEVIGNVIKKEN